MPLLALNTVLPSSMRARYQLALGVLPIGLMFASFVPLWFFAPWLEAALGMPPNGPIREHPNGAIWFGIFLVTMVALMVVGYAVGWVANALISRLLLRWPPEKVRAVYLQSEIPAHWLKDGASTSSNAAAQSIEKWEKQRKVGVLRFILVRGVVAWGAPMLLVMYVMPTLTSGRTFAIESLLLNLGLWATAGAVFGAAIWYGSEANYRKLKRRNEA